jgi:hypothetical protein
MRLKYLKTDLVKLPADIELTLYLIKEELKTRKFFSGLSQIDCDGSFYQSDLSQLVLTTAGFGERPDDLYDFYFRLMERHSEKLEPNHEKVIKASFEVYLELMMEKKRREKV